MKTVFNVSKITKYGNDGGSKVTLMPVVNNEVNQETWDGIPLGKLEIINPKFVFEFGEYEVEITKVQNKH